MTIYAADPPPLALRPVTDAEHAWVAMLLATEPLPDENEQTRLWAATGLAEALDGMPCVAPAFGRPANTAGGGFVLYVPAGAVEETAIASELPPEYVGGPCLALDVDSFSAFDRSRKAGFTWFAGNYPLRPTPGMAIRNATRQALLLRLLALLTQDADTRELEDLVKQDPQLSYQLLRLVNSVANARGKRITSFNHAITVLGRQAMQRWLQLLLYAKHDGGGRSPLLPRAAMRAAFMEGLFPTDDSGLREQAFLVGMFSLLDIMLNEPISKLLSPLNLTVEINRALQERSGPLGRALRAVEAAETGNAPLTHALLDAAIERDVWSQAQVRACRWAVRVSREA